MSFGWRNSRWRIPVLLLLFTIFFYWKILLTNRYMFPWDAEDFFYPIFAYVHEELRHLRLPLWNPFAMSGLPIIADPEAQIFYPPNWLFVLLHPFAPLPYKWVEAMLIGHFFLAGLLMFYLAREFTREDFSALVGGVLFMSSGAMVAHTQHVATVEAMAWYPLVFLLARRGLLYRQWRWSLAAGFVMGIGNLVGHWQHSVYLGLLLFLYFLYEAAAGPLRRHLWPHWLAHLFLIGAIGTGLAMIQILPTAQLGPHSIRTQLTYWDITQGNDPRYLWTLFLPNFFGGLNGVPWLEPVEPSFNYVFLTVPGCLLALVGLLEMARRRNFFWLGLIMLCVELSFGRNGHLAGLVYHTPLLNLFRHMPVFFDLANFALCLMAAVGMKTLCDRDTRAAYFRWLPGVLLLALAAAAAWGVARGLAWRIPGWYHMLAVLALFCLILALWRKGQITAAAARGALLLLMVFQLLHYSQNQPFNWSINDPRTHLAYHFAAHRTESLQFLRADAGGDFRVAAIDGSPWGSNGSNVWRLPAIYGWNPIMLRDYRDYLRQFTHLGNGALPTGGPDHRLDSSLLDLLGVKYLLIIRHDEQQQRLSESQKFRRVFTESEWRVIYRNNSYLPRAWFYPRAYVLPGRPETLALMNSSWFDPRRALLFAAPDVPASRLSLADTLPVVSLAPAQVAAFSGGRRRLDPACAEQREVWGDWHIPGTGIRFDLPALPQPGRYTLLVEYAAGYSVPPTLAAEVAQQERTIALPPVTLLRTYGWNCSETRTAELGQVELAAAPAAVTLTLRQNSLLNLYALWLVRLPQELPPAASSASFRDFSASPNQISFRAELPQEGFVLLNELWYPGWEATVNGERAEILRAGHIFRALALPPGSHRVEMRFRPRHFWAGAFVSLLTLAGLLAYFRSLRPRKAQPPQPAT